MVTKLADRRDAEERERRIWLDAARSDTRQRWRQEARLLGPLLDRLDDEPQAALEQALREHGERVVVHVERRMQDLTPGLSPTNLIDELVQKNLQRALAVAGITL